MAEGRMVSDVSEFRSWLYAFLFMLALSVTVLVTRFFFGPVLNTAFEVCIFYIPTVILFVIVLRVRMKQV
jgi:hypothetical protein